MGFERDFRGVGTFVGDLCVVGDIFLKGFGRGFRKKEGCFEGNGLIPVGASSKYQCVGSSAISLNVLLR